MESLFSAWAKCDDAFLAQTKGRREKEREQKRKGKEEEGKQKGGASSHLAHKLFFQSVCDAQWRP